VRRATAVKGERLWRPIGHFSLGVKAGSFVFVSGSTGRNPRLGQTDQAQFRPVGAGNIEDQAAQAFENIKDILEEAGSGLDDIVKMTVFLTSADDYPAFDRTRAKYFPHDPPASIAVVVQRLIPPGLHLEIDAIAFVG
jgi:2-iminobutanoate/2-iminopropanoate deaminase